MSDNLKVEFIDTQLMDRVSAEGRKSPRWRMNYNFHRNESDPVNRLLNAMHRGSYLPVHRHLSPSRSESCVVLRGKVGITIYADDGTVVERRVVGAACDTVGVDIEAGVWHGLVVLEDDTVLMEVKQGPYAPISAENIAPWSPNVADVVAVERFVKELEESFNND